jgi:hypothetical protein
MPSGASPETLEKARRLRWVNRTPEERSEAGRRALNYRWARVRSSNVERCVNVQGDAGVYDEEGDG